MPWYLRNLTKTVYPCKAYCIIFSEKLNLHNLAVKSFFFFYITSILLVIFQDKHLLKLEFSLSIHWPIIILFF